jgi:hypothetical protein
MEFPWGDCKVAFDSESDDHDKIFNFFGYENKYLPKGWELNEIDGTGARTVIIFRVNELLTIEDGNKVLALLTENKL